MSLQGHDSAETVSLALTWFAVRFDGSRLACDMVRQACLTVPAAVSEQDRRLGIRGILFGFFFLDPVCSHLGYSSSSAQETLSNVSTPSTGVCWVRNVL